MTSVAEPVLEETAPPVQMTVSGESDLLAVRSLLRGCAARAGLGVTATTKLVTAGSELARNILRYATNGQGTVRAELVAAAGRTGVQVTFRDGGPGIADLEPAMRDGFSSGGSLGLGLPGSRRLADDFAIDSRPGIGTTVEITIWAR